MPPTEAASADETRRAPRRVLCVLAAVVVAGGFLLIYFTGVVPGFGPAAPPPVPSIDLSGAHPLVARAIEEARVRVRRSPDSAEAWGRLGMVLLAHEYGPEAARSFGQAARLDWREFRWPYYHAVAIEGSDPEAAAEYYEAAAALDASYAPLYRRWGDTLVRLNRVEQADELLRRGLELDPSDVQMRLSLGGLAISAGDPLRAVDVLSPGVRAAPGNRPLRAALAQAYLAAGDAAAAEREQQAAALLPDAPVRPPDPLLSEVAELDVMYARLAAQADELAARGDLAAAENAYRVLVEARPELARPRINLAGVLQERGDVGRAVAILEECVAAFPHEPMGYYSLAVARRASGDRQGARRALERAIALKPDYRDALFALALLEVEEQNLPAARAALEQAIEADPGFAPASAYLGMVLVEMGEFDAAIERLRIAVALAPDDPFAAEQLERASAARAEMGLPERAADGEDE